MDIRKEVKNNIKKRGYSLTRVVNEMNKRMPEDKVGTTVQNMSNKLGRGTIKYSELKLIADIIGMKLVWEEKEYEGN